MNKDIAATEALKGNLSAQGVEIQDIGDYGNLPENGLMRTQSPYSTAVQVIKPRDLNKVESRCLAEAARAGDEFYYSWSQGGSIIEGNTVGAALMMIRNWGNCAVDVKVQELPSSYIFYGAFIDLETGFNLVRPFKMSKQSPKNKQGREIYSGERGKDIIFQIGASKAIRNVTLNALPKWLTEKTLDTAKQNVAGKVERMGKEKAIQLMQKKAESSGIPWDRVEANYGKKASWDTDKIVAVMGAIRSVEDGVESMDEVFSDKVAVNGEPEIKKKTGKTDQTAETDYTNPESIMERVAQIKTIQEFDNWEKKHKQDLEMISGKDGELLQRVIADKKESFKK